MDERLRKLERTDRRRWLIERHRAGLELVYELGDIVKIVRWADWDTAKEREMSRKHIVGRTGIVCALPRDMREHDGEFYAGSMWTDVRLEEPVFPYAALFVCRDKYTVPCEHSDLEPA